MTVLFGESSRGMWDTADRARFDAKVAHGNDDECWPYTGGRFKDRNGLHSYGAFDFKGRTVKAHRMAYALANGPFDAEKKVCHSCDNPVCCNPRHLFIGTYADNNRGRNAKGRQARGTVVSTARLDEGHVQAIRADRRPSRVVAAEYGVSKSEINNVRSGQTWRHLP